MTSRSRALVLLLHACLASTAAAQQTDANAPAGLIGQSEPAYLGPDADPHQGRIGIDVTVTDSQGYAVTGLRLGDFKLLDEGQLVQPVTFAATTENGPAPGDPAVSVILVVDEADLSRADFTQAQSDVEAFLRSNNGRLKQTVTVYRVTSDKLYASNPFTDDGNALADLIASGMDMRAVWKNPSLRILRGPTNEVEIGSAPEADAGLPHGNMHPVPVPIALKALGAIALEQRRVPGRKLLFWIGPGWKVDSKSDKDLFETITEFATRLREARIELSIADRWSGPEDSRYILTDEQVRQYASGVRFAQGSNYDNLALQVLAMRAGGEVLTTNDKMLAAAQPDRNNIPRLLAEHIAEAGNYYRLTFDPPRAENVDEYHRLNVELARPGLTAHTTAGYYDEPVYYDQPLPATEQVTVAQLEQRLARKQSDREVASGLAGLQMTERIGTPRLEEWLKHMPGERSRQALTALADASSFLPPPGDEVLSTPAPDLAAQRAMLSRVAEFLVKQVPRLPNFYAQRTTIQFGEPLPKAGETWKTAQSDRKLYFERNTAERIFFEDGKETTDQRKMKVKQSFLEDKLETTGTFGPILVLAFKAAAAPGGVLAWSRWEKGQNGPVAVFQYTSPPKTYAYDVGFCCQAIDEGMIAFRRDVPFHGEFAVDPDTGHILRLTVQADLAPRLPLQNSSILVEYGPVDMGGQTYFCPVHSVSMSRQRRLWAIDEWGMTFKIYGPFKTVLNDVTFDHYHLFRSETTILPGFVPVPESQ
ncbi:MAG TPA: VWA domain-containing protein [Terracidiphilus sp.]|nr:VWA domain-containing protein [Terracidiphilus sp.]